MKNQNTKKLAYAALFLALCLVLPMLTGQIPRIGSMLLPMHIPVLLCGLVCGWQYGAAVGFVAPLLRSVLFGMPPMYPVAIAMAFELLTYGLVRLGRQGVYRPGILDGRTAQCRAGHYRAAGSDPRCDGGLAEGWSR